eukprot:SAG31_NODE_1192_length_9459_cov_15.271581_9_plen_161_part_00
MLNNGRAYPPATVKDSDRDNQLAKWLACHFPHADECHWSAKISDGTVAVDQTVETDPAAKLHPGAKVFYTRPPWTEPLVPIDWGEPLFEDASLTVINKPAGLPTMPSEQYFEHTVINLLKKHYPTAPPAPAHRLGVGTSGVLLCPRTPSARRMIGRQFQE